MTSVDFLEKELKEKYNLMNSEPIFEQAKQMHKEEIEDVYQDGKWDWYKHVTNRTESRDQAQYYQEKFTNDTI